MDQWTQENWPRTFSLRRRYIQEQQIVLHTFKVGGDLILSAIATICSFASSH